MLSYVLAGVGLALAAVSMVALLKRGLNHRAANQMFAKLASTGAVDRMRKLCRAAGTKGTYFDAIEAALAAGASAGTRERDALTEAVEGAYDRVSLEVAARWKAHAERGLLGVIVVGAGVGLALSDGSAPALLLGMGAAGAAIGAYLMMKRGAMIEALLAGRETILPPLVDALSGVVVSPAPAEAAEPATNEESVPRGAVRVRIHRDGRFVRSQTLELEVIKIGRMQKSHLQLQDDDVSRMHAVIENGAEVCVIDLGTGDTRVNGEKITKKALRTGDVIEIGPFRLEVEIGAR